MSRFKRPKSTCDADAEGLALAALVFLTEDPGRLTRFLGDTGIAPGELAAAAGEPHTLAAVLDFVLADESLLLVFADHAGIDPAAVEPARAAFAGAGSAKGSHR